MATIAIGDVHGCYRTLRALLDEAGVVPGRDRLWFTGDLVNRGPASLDVLRFVADLGERAVTVLGNHDLHLLARAAGLAEARRGDTLEAVLGADDGDTLLAWLRDRPLVHREDDALLVHAGLLPAWDAADAERIARETEAALRGPGGESLLDRAAGPDPVPWRDDLPDAARARLALATFTRLRACRHDGVPALRHTEPPEALPDGVTPWFAMPSRRSRGVHVIFGHWAALGTRRGEDWTCLDSGCAWGSALSALRLDDGTMTRVGVLDALDPGGS